MKKFIPLFVLAALVLTSCKTTYMTNSTNVSNQKKKYDKILVVYREGDMTGRIALENQIVRDLAAQGVSAVSSVQVIKTDSFQKELTEAELDQLVDALLDAGYTGVLVTNLLDKSQYTQVTPGATYGGYGGYYGGFRGYYGAYPMTYREPDRVTTGIEYILETVMFDISDNDGENLQWVGRFSVKNPTDVQKTVAKYSEELVTELMAHSISN
ncbi:MAG: hypothetical protein ACR2MM_13770 [Flavobacteriaceae bacterium]